jgi:cell division protein FtsQ
MKNPKPFHIARKAFAALASLAMIVGFVTLFIAASRGRKNAACQSVAIHVKGTSDKIFISRQQIMQCLTADSQLNPVGKPLAMINTRLLERSVRTFPWVREAQVYVDNDNVLQVLITEREPVARVFTVSGNTFYIDSAGTVLPVKGGFAVRVPVFTNFPSDAVNLRPADSVLFARMIPLSQYIHHHPFWSAQIDQININAERKFELIPTVGDALIELGDGTGISEKFDKLLAFYREGLNNVGWGVYDTLDLQYAGQVVAKRKPRGENPIVDSLLTQYSYAGMEARQSRQAAAHIPGPMQTGADAPHAENP